MVGNIVCTPTVGNSPVCIQDTSLTHLQHNRINVKITKWNATIKYMRKVTVAELKAMPLVWTFTRQGKCFACLIAATNCSERQALDMLDEV